MMLSRTPTKGASADAASASDDPSNKDMEMQPMIPDGQGGGGGADGLTSPLKDSAGSNNNNATSSASSSSATAMTSPMSPAGPSAMERASSTKVLTACGMYSFCSVSMVLTNKSLASSYNHFIKGDLNILLVVFQAVVAVVCVEFCKRMKWVEYPSFNMRTARLWAPVNILFCAMLFTGMASLQLNSVPMVTIFKNITNIIVTFGDFYFFGTRVETLVLVAFGVMLGGAVEAAWNDISISMIGLFWMGMNCFSTAGYILYMKFATKNVKLSKFGMVFYNNVLACFFLLPASIFRGEVTLLIQTPALHTWDYFLKNVFAGWVGFFLNFSSLNCVAVTGPTTYAIVGSLNKVPVAILGYILFDNVITAQTWFFIGVSMCGGFLYSYAQIQAGRRKAMSSNSK